MGTVVHAGSGTGVVAASGGGAESGRIALGPGEHQPDTGFQVGLRGFSMVPGAASYGRRRHLLVGELQRIADAGAGG